MSPSLPSLTLLAEVQQAPAAPVGVAATDLQATPGTDLEPEAQAAALAQASEGQPDQDAPAEIEAAADEADTVAQAPQIVVVPLVCRSVGPFPEQVEARRAAALLAQTGRVPIQRVAEGEVWLGYWVYLPPFPDRQAAGEAADALERALVQDFYIVGRGPQEHAISLGVFSERGRAESRIEEIRALGFEPESGDRFRSAPVYWLDYSEPEDDVLPLSALRTAAPGRILRAETSDCALP